MASTFEQPPASLPDPSQIPRFLLHARRDESEKVPFIVHRQRKRNTLISHLRLMKACLNCSILIVSGATLTFYTAELSSLFSSIREPFEEIGNDVRNVTDPATAHVINSRFYRDASEETRIVERIKNELPQRIVEGRSFSNLWELGRYLTFLQERELELRAFTTAFDRSKSPNMSECNEEGCTVDASNSNSSNINFGSFLDYLNEIYVKRLRLFLYQNRLVEARRIASILDQRLRLLDIRSSNITHEAGTLNRYYLYILLATSFSDLSDRNGRTSDWIAAIESHFSNYESDTLLTLGNDLSRYANGLRNFRALCFKEAKSYFDELAASRNPIASDVAYLLLARIQFHSVSGKKLSYMPVSPFRICDEKNLLQVSLEGAAATIRAYKQHTRRKSFQTDLDEYISMLEAIKVD